jgi:membrane carboxypeptidase/penicillin-binding protein PbpC
MVDIPKSSGFFTPTTDNLELKKTQFIKDLLTIEDGRFFEHFSIDSRAKIRALIDNIE